MKKKSKMEAAVQKIASIGKALDNPTRVKIIELCLNKGYNILSLAEKLDISYVVIYNHVQNLERAGLVKTEKQKNVSGQAVSVTTSLPLFISVLNKSNKEIYKDLLNRYRKGLKDRISEYVTSSNKKPVNTAELKQLLSGIPFEVFISAYKDDFLVFLDKNGIKVGEKSENKK